MRLFACRTTQFCQTQIRAPEEEARGIFGCARVQLTLHSVTEGLDGLPVPDQTIIGNPKSSALLQHAKRLEELIAGNTAQLGRMNDEVKLQRA